MDGDKGYPGVEHRRKLDHFVRRSEQRPHEDLEQANQDGHLDNERAEAADGTDAGLPVETHRFLGNAGPVAAVAFLNFPHPGLQFAHPPHLANLLQGQGQSYQPHQDGKDDNRQAHIVE